jgi:hypothetical protein
MLVVEADRGMYRSALVEGPVTMRSLGDGTEVAMLAMSSRYLGEKGGGVPPLDRTPIYAASWSCKDSSYSRGDM